MQQLVDAIHCLGHCDGHSVSNLSWRLASIAPDLSQVEGILFLELIYHLSLILTSAFILRVKLVIRRYNALSLHTSILLLAIVVVVTIFELAIYDTCTFLHLI